MAKHNNSDVPNQAPLDNNYLPVDATKKQPVPPETANNPLIAHGTDQHLDSGKPRNNANEDGKLPVNQLDGDDEDDDSEGDDLFDDALPELEDEYDQEEEDIEDTLPVLEDEDDLLTGRTSRFAEDDEDDDEDDGL